MSYSKYLKMIGITEMLPEDVTTIDFSYKGEDNDWYGTIYLKNNVPFSISFYTWSVSNENIEKGLAEQLHEFSGEWGMIETSGGQGHYSALLKKNYTPQHQEKEQGDQLMKATIAGHEIAYCHHDLSENAQRLGAFIVENEFSTQEVMELVFRMLADAAYTFREDRDTPTEFEDQLETFVRSYNIFYDKLVTITDKETLPKTLGEAFRRFYAANTPDARRRRRRKARTKKSTT